MTFKAYKYRIYPTEGQQIKLSEHFGCCRWLYNYALNKKKNAYEKDKTNISLRDIQNELPLLKKAEGTQWLSAVNAQSLQATLLQLDSAYKGFFKLGRGFPKFKKKINNQSFSVPQRVEVDFENKFISIPKIKNIPIVITREFYGKIKTVTICKTPTGKYFASILVEIDLELPYPKPIIKETSIGLDLGLKDFLIRNNGKKYENHKFLKQLLDRLKILQYRASKKKKGSNSRKKANLKVARLHEKITNQREDYLHKLSTKLIKYWKCMQTFSQPCKAGMVKNHMQKKFKNAKIYLQLLKKIKNGQN